MQIDGQRLEATTRQLEYRARRVQEGQEHAQLAEDRQASHREVIREEKKLREYVQSMSNEEDALKHERDELASGMQSFQQRAQEETERSQTWQQRSSELEQALRAAHGVIAEGKNKPTIQTLGLYWNAWTEEYGANPTFQPVLRLRPSTEYVSWLSVKWRSGVLR